MNEEQVVEPIFESEHRKGWSAGRIIKLVGAFLVLAMVVGVISLSFIKVDKVIIEPGSAETVADKIDFGGAETFSDNGEIRFLTVLVSSRKPSYTEYLVAKYLK